MKKNKKKRKNVKKFIVFILIIIIILYLYINYNSVLLNGSDFVSNLSNVLSINNNDYKVIKQENKSELRSLKR